MSVESKKKQDHGFHFSGNRNCHSSALSHWGNFFCEHDRKPFAGPQFPQIQLNCPRSTRANDWLEEICILSNSIDQ